MSNVNSFSLSDARIRVIAFYDNLTSAKFYGTLEIKFEAGKPVLIRKEETLKLADLSA